MNFRRWWTVGGFVLALSLPAAYALGTTLVHTRFDELRARADIVAHVQVETSSSVWTGEHHARIVTFHEVTVVQVHQGELTTQERTQQRLLVGVPGGVVDDLAQWVPESPSLQAGEEYLLLLGPASGPGGARGVVGLRYGVLPFAKIGVSPAPNRGGSSGASAP